MGVAATATLLSGIIVAVTSSAATAAPGIPGGAIVVSNGTGSGLPAGCATPTYTSIQAAVTAAPSNSTIYVCAGTYDESVTITEPLTLDGAEYGVAAPGRSSAETIIQAPSNSQGAIVYGSGAATGTVNGFTLDGNNSANNPTGISAFGSAGAGYTWTDNIIENNAMGINFNATGVGASTSITGNLFLKNNATPSNGDSGTGIFFTNGVANDVSITGNTFQDEGLAPNGGNADINTTGNESGVGSNLTISGNTETLDNTGGNDTYDNNFLALFQETGVLITGNQITDNDASDPDADSAIYVGGGASDTTISDNTITGGLASGVNLTTDFYAGGSNIDVTGNTISQRNNGVNVRGTNSGFTISDNIITQSANDGITISSTSSGLGSITGNSISGSGNEDCADVTTGSETAGTDDSWSGDVGETSSPTGLCQATDTVTSAPANATITLGQADNDLVTVAGNSTDGNPSGSVSFYECGPTTTAAPCASTVAAVGTPVALTPGAGDTATATSAAFTPTGTGFWCFAAVYGGNSKYGTGQDATTDECVHVTSASASIATTPTSANPALGSTNTDTVAVTGNATAGSPTGTVTFFSCGPNPGSSGCTPGASAVGTAVALAPGPGNTATATSSAFKAPSAGTWCFAVSYSGDARYSAQFQGGSTECFTVSQVTSSTATTPTKTSMALGNSDTDGATVSGTAAAGSPTGSVQFDECGPSLSAAACTSTANPVGSAVALIAAAGNTATATSPAFTPTGTGWWCFAGHYSGDINYSSSSDTLSNECVDVTVASTSTVSAPTQASVVVGNTDTDGVTVTGNSAGGSPTGSVLFYECGPTTVPTACNSTSHPVGSTVSLTSGASSTATATSPTFKATSTGYWCFYAVYSGDPNYNTSSDGTTDECFDVTQATSATVTAPTSTTLTLGNTDTDGATVTGSTIPGKPTGSVSFYECGPTSVATPCTSTAHQVGSAVAVTAGAGATATATSSSFTPTSTGYWCFAAVYSGDTNYFGSSDTTIDECVHVTAAASTTATTPMTTSIALGNTDSDSANVIGNLAGGDPTGSVSFYECGPTPTQTACTSTANPVGSAVTVTGGASDTATATSGSFTPTATGYWCFAGVYSGDTNYTASSDTTIGECVHVTPAISTTVTSPTNTTITLGQADTDLATVTGNTAGGNPTGSVAFYQCGPSASATPCTSTANQVGGSVAVSAGSGATSTATSASFTPTATGYTCFMAVYSGDGNYFTSSDTTTDECVDVVSSADTVTTSAPTTPTFVVGGSDTDVATVTGNPAGGSPSGTVSFYVCGPTTSATPCASTAHQVGSAVAVVSASSDTAKATSASFTPTGAGYWCFEAVYSGGSGYFGSSDGSTDECFDVTGAATSTATVPTSLTLALGASNTDNVSVTGNAAAGSPTGTVSFFVCGPSSSAAPCTSTANPVGSPVHLTTGANNASSAISPSFTPTAIGTWCFAGVYSGSTSYNSSADATIDECFKVTTGQSVTTSAPAQATIVTGSADTDVATVTGSVAGGSPAGTVTFYDCGPTTSAAACTSTANQLGTPVNLTAGANDTSTADSVQFTPTALGYWCFASVYSGSTLYAGSTDHTTDECFDVLAHAQGLQILTTSLPPGVKGTAYKVTLSASGGTQPYHWNSTKMPPGIGLNKLTGVIAGNPKKVGTFTITLRVKDRSHPKQSATQIVTLVVTS